MPIPGLHCNSLCGAYSALPIYLACLQYCLLCLPKGVYLVWSILDNPVCYAQVVCWASYSFLCRLVSFSNIRSILSMEYTPRNLLCQAMQDIIKLGSVEASFQAQKPCSDWFRQYRADVYYLCHNGVLWNKLIFLYLKTRCCKYYTLNIMYKKLHKLIMDKN